MQLTDYQINKAKEGYKILQQYHIVYFVMQQRTGKTLTALTAANMLQVKNVLFLSPKKAHSSIQSDYNSFKFNFKITITNYEQAQNLKPEYDLVIIDEAHSLGAFPKPSQRTQAIKDLVGDNYLILLSGTPTPESYSQIYHQLWVSDYSPFKAYSKFYKWAKDYVEIKQRRFNGFPVNDYSHADKEKIENEVGHLYVKWTQQQAGFKAETTDLVINVPMLPGTMNLVGYMLKNKYYQGKDGSDIVADTAAKLQSKIHQICSGTVIDDKKNVHIFDTSKIDYIKERYKGKKIALFYKYIGELAIIKQAFPDMFTDSDLFNQASSGVYASQIRSGAMGVNLSTADYIVMYNIDFSAVLYWQARERMQDMARTAPCEVHWIFSEGGIEDKIYKVVLKKKPYTSYYFRKDYLKEAV
jgi:hypothetical protein